MSIFMSNPARAEQGIDLNQVAQREYRERRNPVDVPLEGPIMSPEPVLPMWAISVAAFFVVGVLMQFGRMML
jgi:hypothetical protein